ncbi:MAG: hypothetical protein WCP20_22630 [Desulfuromonadales bacterium]
MYTSIETFLAELNPLCRFHFPAARLETVYQRSAMVSMRLIITPRLFVDIYFNTSTKRSDFSLILDSARVFGYDNPLLSTQVYRPASLPRLLCGSPVTAPSSWQLGKRWEILKRGNV